MCASVLGKFSEESSEFPLVGCQDGGCANPFQVACREGVQTVGIDDHGHAAAGDEVSDSGSGLLPLTKSRPDGHRLLVLCVF